MKDFKTKLLGLAILSSIGLTAANAQEAEFLDDLQFLQEHTEVVLLQHNDSAVAVAPAYQGRVMTSTYDLQEGPSFGWINRPVIAKGILPDEDRKGTLEDHIYVFGGEERFWLGPEGGQFSIYFKPEADFVFEQWHTPPCIATAEYKIVKKRKREVSFQHRCQLENWSGFTFDVEIHRIVRLLTPKQTAKRLGIDLPESVKVVAYETVNTIKNMGDQAWTKETGMLSIWLLGMYPPDSKTTLAIPILKGPEEDLGPKVNDTYFGKVPPEYLTVEDDAVFMKGDGTYRAKTGISPKRSKGIAGSYDGSKGILNLVTASTPAEHPGYVNSMWELQDDPFSGDVLNAYNDGSPTPSAAPLGPFYELETSSPAADLAPGESLTHTQLTVHIKGAEEDLNIISKQTLGIDLHRIQNAF